MAIRKRARDEKQSPLGKEYARLESLSTDDPLLYTFAARRTVRADELVVWTASVGDSKFPIGPPTGRPNPIVTADLVLCSTFSPGGIVAFNRSTGATRWSLRLAYFGDEITLGSPGSGLVYSGTSQELLAIEAASGRVVWSFCPYGRNVETIYSSPAVAGDHLFVGDRRGYLHCLAAATGEPVWQVLTSRAAKNQVNSDPVVFGGVVVVGTTARLAAAYDTATGREVWRHRLDGPCCKVVPARAGAALLCTNSSGYLLSVLDGTVLERWHRRNYGVDQACVADGLTLLVTRREWGKTRLPWPVAELRAYRNLDEVYASTYPRSAGPTIRYEPATGRVYEATSFGLGILNPRTGDRETVINFGDDDVPYGRVGQPTVLDGLLYTVGDDGRVFALEHP
jgi:outer membrane protein assembly factor BamB